MSPADAVFLSLAAACLADRPRRWWLAALVPLAAWAIGAAGVGRFQAPLAALLAAAAFPGLAAPALLLALPTYAGWADALRSGLVWLAALGVLAGLAERLDSEDLPPRIRGAPARLLAAGALYFALLPAFHLA